MIIIGTDKGLNGHVRCRLKGLRLQCPSGAAGCGGLLKEQAGLLRTASQLVDQLSGFLLVCVCVYSI